MDCVHHPGVDAPYQCCRCREFICVDCEAKVEGRSYCRSCLANIHRNLSSRYEAETRNISYGLAFVSGAGVALLVAALWSQVTVWINFTLQFWPALLGGAVGYSIVSGTGGKRGEKLQKMAFAITLIGAFIGFFLSALRLETFIPLLQDRNLDPAGFSPLSGTLSVFPAYLTQKVGPLGWFFVLVGIGWAWYIPHERHVPD